MTKNLHISIDPAEIFLHAHRFNQAYKTLIPVRESRPDGLGDEILGQPAAVLSALSSELFLKCLICIETGAVPHGHHLNALYEQLSPSVQKRIFELWNKTVVPLRLQQWGKLDPSDTPPRHLLEDLKAALVAGAKTFEKIRYSYEGRLENFAFVISDLPLVLSHVAIELKPELKSRHPTRSK